MDPDAQSPGLFSGLGNMLGLGNSQGSTQSPPMTAQKLAMAQALMGGGQGPAANSFAGGLSQGANPMLKMAMMQKMGNKTPQPGTAPNADMGGPASTPYMLGGTPQQ